MASPPRGPALPASGRRGPPTPPPRCSGSSGPEPHGKTPTVQASSAAPPPAALRGAPPFPKRSGKPGSRPPVAAARSDAATAAMSRSPAANSGAPPVVPKRVSASASPLARGKNVMTERSRPLGPGLGSRGPPGRQMPPRGLANSAGRSLPVSNRVDAPPPRPKRDTDEFFILPAYSPVVVIAPPVHSPAAGGVAGGSIRESSASDATPSLKSTSTGSDRAKEMAASASSKFGDALRVSAKFVKKTSKASVEKARDFKKVSLSDLVCPKCHRAFVDGSRPKVTWGGKVFHRECLRCSVCSDIFFVEGNIVVDPQNRPVHEECATGTFDPSSRCKRCFKVFSSSDQVVSARGVYFHSACFACAHCQQSFDADFTVQNYKPFHLACWEELCTSQVAGSGFKRLVLRCKKCKRPFAQGETKFSALDRVWHKACFTCKRCGKPFAEEFTQRGHNPYHVECARDADQEAAEAQHFKDQIRLEKQRGRDMQREQKRAQHQVKRLRAAGERVSWHGARVAAIAEQQGTSGNAVLPLKRGDVVVVLNLNVAQDDPAIPPQLASANQVDSQGLVIEGFCNGRIGFLPVSSVDLSPSQQQVKHIVASKEAILATRDYQPIWNSFASPDLIVAMAVCSIITTEDIQPLSKILLSVISPHPEMFEQLLVKLCQKDASASQDQSTLFRSNTVATTLLNELFIADARTYLRLILKPLWESTASLISTSGDECVEVDPRKLTTVPLTVPLVSSAGFDQALISEPPTDDAHADDMLSVSSRLSETSSSRIHQTQMWNEETETSGEPSGVLPEETESSNDSDPYLAAVVNYDPKPMNELDADSGGSSGRPYSDSDLSLPGSDTLASGTGPTEHNDRLESLCRSLLDSILTSGDVIPDSIARSCAVLADVVSAAGYPSATHTVVAGFFFLRGLTPSISNPDGFGLFDPDDAFDMNHLRRPLVLVAKVLQSIANGRSFREDFMIFLNPLVEEYSPRLREFMDATVAKGRKTKFTGILSRPVDAPTSQRLYRGMAIRLGLIVHAANARLDMLSSTDRPKQSPIESLLEAVAVVGPAL